MTVEDGEVVLAEARYRLRLSHRRARVISAAPAAIQVRLARVGVYLIKRLQRQHPQMAVTKPRWDVVHDHESIRYPNVAWCTFGWADIQGLVEQAEGPLLTLVPDNVMTISIPRLEPNRAMRRAR